MTSQAYIGTIAFAQFINFRSIVDRRRHRFVIIIHIFVALINLARCGGRRGYCRCIKYHYNILYRYILNTLFYIAIVHYYELLSCVCLCVIFNARIALHFHTCIYRPSTYIYDLYEGTELIPLYAIVTNFFEQVFKMR